MTPMEMWIKWWLAWPVLLHPGLYDQGKRV